MPRRCFHCWHNVYSTANTAIANSKACPETACLREACLEEDCLEEARLEALCLEEACLEEAYALGKLPRVGLWRVVVSRRLRKLVASISACSG